MGGILLAIRMNYDIFQYKMMIYWEVFRNGVASVEDHGVDIQQIPKD